MNKRITKLIALLCIMFMWVNLLTVFATDGEESQKLYEKYGYNENFEYNATSVGFALRSSVPRIETVVSGTVEYQPVVFDEEKLLATFSELYEEYGIETEEEERALIAKLIEDMKVNTFNYLSYGDKKRTSAEGGGTGSGVVISEDGYIATNSHVVSLTDEDKKMLYLSELNEDIVDDVIKIVEEIAEYGVEFSEEEAEALYEVILVDAADKMRIIDEDIRWNVCFPTADGKTGVDDANIYEATVIEEGTQYDIEGFTEDAAILKIDVENLVALKFASDYPDLNEAIVSAGFPADANDIFENSGSMESVLSIFSSAGTVSRLVPVEGSSYQAIGMNTTISNGSSGGPSVDMQLNIEGLNTYGDAEDKRFAYMVPAAYVTDLAKDIELKQGDVTKTFLTGIQLLQNNYGPAALECFEFVAKEQPEIPFIQEMIKKAQNAPQNEYVGTTNSADGKKTDEKNADENGFVGFLKKNWIIVAVGAFVLVAIIVTIIVVVSKKKKKKTAINHGIMLDPVEDVPAYVPENQGYGTMRYDDHVRNESEMNYSAPSEYHAMGYETKTQPNFEAPMRDGDMPIGVNDAYGMSDYENSVPVEREIPVHAESVAVEQPMPVYEQPTEPLMAEKPVLRSTMPKPRTGGENPATGGTDKPLANEAFSTASDLD